MNTGVATARRLVAPDVFDALQLGALMAGGIKDGPFWDGSGCPNCVHGIAAYVTDAVEKYDSTRAEVWDNPVSVCLRDLGIGGVESDGACQDINERKGRPLDARVTFEEWCAELGIVRRGS